MPRPLGAACPQGHREVRTRGRGLVFAAKLFGRMTDALAADGDEGRGKRRYSTARRRRPVTRGSPNGATPQGDPCDPGPNQIGPGGDTGGSETSQYPEEKKSNESPPVAASERGGAQTGGFIPRGCRAGEVSGGRQRRRLERRAVEGDSPVRETVPPPGGAPE